MEVVLCFFSQLQAIYFFWAKWCSELEGPGTKRSPGLCWGPRRSRCEASSPWAGWVIRDHHWSPEGGSLEPGKNLAFPDLWTCSETSEQGVPARLRVSLHYQAQGCQTSTCLLPLTGFWPFKYLTAHAWAPLSQQRRTTAHLKGGGPSAARENAGRTNRTHVWWIELLEETDKHLKKGKSF